MNETNRTGNFSVTSFALNSTTAAVIEEYDDGWQWDDATWILCNSFIIFTMQTGLLCYIHL